MNRLELPNQLNVALNIEAHFNYNCVILEEHSKEREHIALIEDTHQISKKVSYYTVVWHDGGYVLCHYSQKFDALIGAMVVYKKLRDALNSNMIEECWKAMINRAEEES